MIRPSFAGLDRARLLAATDAEIATWMEEAQRADEAAAAPVRARCVKHEQILALAPDVWSGDDLKKAEKWLREHRPRWPMNRWVDRVRDIQRDAEEYRRKKSAEIAKGKDVERHARAIAWLAVRGKMPVAHYDLDRAIDAANELAAHEEIERRTADQAWHAVNGCTCEGPCPGWDGRSQRCHCGNNRVSWSRGYGHSFEAPTVYAEIC